MFANFTSLIFRLGRECTPQSLSWFDDEILWRKVLPEERLPTAKSLCGPFPQSNRHVTCSFQPVLLVLMHVSPTLLLLCREGGTCAYMYVLFCFVLLPLVYVKTKVFLPSSTPSIPCTQHLTHRQMKPFKYLFIMSSVPIRPCNSCHAPHVSLKHNVINTSSALMDASHMNALMKCVIVFPHRTLTIYLTLCLRGPAELLKTTSYQMNPQFRLSNFKFKFITEASLMWEEDTSLWGLWGPASITIKSNRRQELQEGGEGERSIETKPCQDEIGKIWVSPGWFVSCFSLCLWADGLNNEDGIGFLLKYTSTGGLLVWWHSWHIKRD